MGLTAAAGLKLDLVLQMMIVSIARIMTPVLRFSHTIEAQMVPKDKTVLVPFIPLETAASTDWDAGTGYTTGDFNVDKRPVPVNKRKFQALQFTAQDLLGMPSGVLNAAMQMKADKLAFDVVQDICSGITAANFGAAILTSAAGAFDSDDVLDLDTTLTDTPNFWPAAGRALVLKPTYTGNLKKDSAIKNAQASGSDSALRRGDVGMIGNFPIFNAPGLPANGENLVGFAALPFAMLLANAPIEATEEVKEQLSDFRVVQDPETKLTMTYRAWGNPDLDSAKRIVEIGYGYAKGDAAQLKRIVSA